MFSRRQNRSVHDTSYTGVNPAASRVSQPNSNALAAALSIGKSLKQQGNLEGYAPSSGSNNPLAQPPQKRNSLLKRNSITRSPGNNKFRNFSDASYNSTNSIQTPPRSNQRRSSIQGPARGSQSVDASFEDSYYDEAHQDAQNYNNANMRDLRLSHQMSPPPSGNRNQESVKMVKKYIPTPNGIKVIEVPETVYKKEMARNNSMRSMPRSGSMTSLSQRKLPRTTSLSSVSGAANKSSHHRLSSLGRGSTLRTMTEKNENQHDNNYNNNSELEKLQQQIDHEKQVSRDLELKRLEYEKIKLDRLENEKKLLILQKESEENRKADEGIIEEDEEEEDEPLPNILLIVDEVENKHLSADRKDSPIEKPSLGQINDMSKDEDINASMEDPSIYENEAIPDASIDASSVVVDELEKKNIEDDEFPNGYKSDLGAAELNVISQYSESKELLNRDSIIDNPISISADEEDEFGIEEVPYDELNEGNLAKQLRPTFDTQPEVIDDSRPIFDPTPEIINDNETEIEKPKDLENEGLESDLGLNIQTLRIPIPPVNNGSSGSSVHSSGSFDSNIISKEEKKPVKSAMKNSSSFYNSSNNSSVVKNAAQDAYLSLATAENTRLNSKLSSSQLIDKQPQTNGSAGQAQSLNYANSYPDNQSTQPKRSTLRKSPSVQSNGLASRSLRPQSALPETLPHNSHQSSNVGMGNRMLRDRSSVQVSPARDRASYVSPISAHPALQPNYQSPSKLRAAELYAKANARPKSSFTPIAKKESSKATANKQQNTQPHRTTLRNISSSGQSQRTDMVETNGIHNKDESNSGPLEHRKGFKSRLADSDEENENEGRSKFFGGGFSSRFNDSDEDVSGVSKSHKVVHGTSNEVPMRNGSSSGLMANGSKFSQEDRSNASSKPKNKEKRKFAKLRKLFGKD